jgi:DNA-binding NarL/FixJ family response regulator
VKSILIVDDSSVLRRTLRALLEAHVGWTVCGEAENGREGIEKALRLHPDLIVLDLIMPVMNGIEASRVLKRVMLATPLLMFTTFATPYLGKEAMDAGVNAVIDKSEGASTLIQRIEQLFMQESPPPVP